jgi:hypothetical protein
LFFSIQNQKTKHPFEETKRNQKNSRETKESKLFPETKNSVSKDCFLGFWFLGGSLSEVTQLQKPKTLEENVGLGSQQAPETNKTYRKNSFL